MNTLALPARPNPMRAYLLEIRNEFMRLLRSPSFAVPTLVFPPMFYLLFAIVLNHKGGPQVATHLLATYGVFGVMAPGLFGFGVAIAMDRERGFLALKRAQPVPAGAVLLSRMAMAMVFAVGISLLLLAIGMALGGVRLSAMQAVTLVLVDMIGVLPFCAIGLFVGSLASGQGAPAVVNMIYLPMAFLAGLWMPLSMLPSIVGTLAPLWPAHHLAQIALQVVGATSDGRAGLHVAVLALYGIVFFLAARRRLARG
ncbi:ABC transporter permease [Lysobacter xinjiangensis]|uniref:ABC transporter permease n=1 Tax=Cognatilysobacter xinjiangensis TaxID=546892 RepID=A0ABQ3C3L9_9GAMM|nr:ABC transporter permease [Lysobacter xinjiangensis]GGZ65844.1 ABC transporter permease [Lysobacter xinjiangensis]